MSLFTLYIKIILLNIVFVNFSKMKKLRHLYNNNEIHLIINGKGTQNLLYNNFNPAPSAVLVNGILNSSCTKSCYLPEDVNNITLQFSEQIKSCENMFLNLNNIIEVDLSDFDSSQVTNMAMMFKNCPNLISVDLSNTSRNKLENISSMFSSCSNMKTINFGNIKTSSVIDMEKLFYGCSSLISVDLSSFDTSKVTSFLNVF